MTAYETMIANNTIGMSFEDAASGFEGVDLGCVLWTGTIKPEEVGNYLMVSQSLSSANELKWENKKSNMESYTSNVSQGLSNIRLFPNSFMERK